MMLHQARLDLLNEQIDIAKTFSLLLKLYKNEKWTPFKSILERNFLIRLRSRRPEDYNSALYLMISQVMSPFAFPGQDGEAVQLYTKTIETLGRERREA